MNTRILAHLLDSGDGADNALVVGNLAVIVLGHIEVDADEHTLALDIYVRESLLLQAERHIDCCFARGGSEKKNVF